MRGLDSYERRALILWSVSLCSASLLLAPLAARSSAGVGVVAENAAPHLALPVLPDSKAGNRYVLTRDPFTADEPVADKAEAGQAARDTGTAVGTTVVGGTPVGTVLPPQNTTGVSAIITGAVAEALIVEAGRSEIVRVGGLIGGVRIVAITSEGVRLASGRILRVNEVRP